MRDFLYIPHKDHLQIILAQVHNCTCTFNANIVVTESKKASIFCLLAGCIQVPLHNVTIPLRCLFIQYYFIIVYYLRRPSDSLTIVTHTSFAWERYDAIKKEP